MGERLGPWRRVERPAGDWTVVMKEHPDLTGSAVWDVYATHPNDGGRYLIGGRGLRDPDAADREAARLVAVIDWPEKAA